MLDQLPRNPGHVGGLPCKDNHIGAQEANKRDFLFRIESCSNDCSLHWVSVGQDNFLSIQGYGQIPELDDALTGISSKGFLHLSRQDNNLD
ncbi:hypothetical protein GUJ93_ZPchr0013g34814 [Zizania palustris]|uniref:Uncharacterized protein n=1 Tax=Zizania palustris TaxID=103762 RepID=A0A8J5WS26_ZIZPA|nr:hypothetical protein GUJ93_ZPchr0013g34814 [Zizania palustris]